MINLCLRLAAALLIGVLFVHVAEAQEERGGTSFADLTPEAEESIDAGLKYLVTIQKPDGSWGDGNKVAYTSLSLMAFMVKGDMPEQPPYGDTMSKGLNYLLKISEDGRGYMGSSMYEHGFATLALSEVWGMSSRDKKVREALKKAVDIIIRSQGGNGAWNYGPSPANAGGDISVSVAQCVALASAKEAGIFVPTEVIDKAVKFVAGCQEKKSGGFGYKGASSPGYARTAAGVSSLMLLGQRDHPGIEPGLKWMQNNASEEKWYEYGRYYASIAMLQAGDDYYHSYYGPVRDKMLNSQQNDGSWNASECRVQMNILILGTPYRFIPIYQR